MFFKRVKRQEPKRRPSAGVINDIAATAEYMTQLRAASPLNIKYTPAGPLFGMTPYLGQLAIANGDIPARSGSAAGVGSVFVVTVEATFSSGGVMASCTLTTSSIPQPVFNASQNTMTSGNGIDSGMYCWIQQDLSGFYAVFPLECS